MVEVTLCWFLGLVLNRTVTYSSCLGALALEPSSHAARKPVQLSREELALVQLQLDSQQAAACWPCARTILEVDPLRPVELPRLLRLAQIVADLSAKEMTGLLMH